MSFKPNIFLAATSASKVVPPRKRGRPKTKVEDATPKPKLLDKLRAATENEARSEPAVYASTTKVTQHVRNCGPQMFLISRKGGTLLTINNFVYRSNLKFFGKSNNILYWECVQNRSVKCRSRLKTIGDDLYVTNDVHNHMGDNKRIEAAKAAGMLIHKKLSSLTAADKLQGSFKVEPTEANQDPLPKM